MMEQWEPVSHELKRKVPLKRSVETKSGVVTNLRAKDLFLAAQDNNADQVRACLDQGLDVDSVDIYGWSALMTASCAGAGDSVRAKEYRLVRALMDAGADVSVIDKSGNNCRRLAKMAITQLRTSLSRVLWRRKVKVTVKTTLMHQPSWSGRVFTARTAS